MPPAVVGPFGTEKHDLLVREIQEIETFYTGQLQQTWTDSVRYNRLYLADRDDLRKPHEKWRACTVVPDAFSSTETAVAALSEIFLSADPPVQAEGIGVEDLPRARKVERLHSYILDRNVWPLNLDIQLRDVKIQGTAAWKVINTTRQLNVRLHGSPQQDKAFDVAIETAVGRGAPDPGLDDTLEDPAKFEAWRNQVNQAGYGPVPELPTAPGAFQQKNVIQYRGPWFDRVSLFDLRFDPFVENVQDQPIVIQRVVKPLKWLMDRTGPGADKKYDAAQVEAALGSRGEQNRLSTYQQQIASFLGLSNFDGKDPIYNQSVELQECWRPGEEAPYLVILNRQAIINKRPDVYPYWHGMIPYVFLRNIPLSGKALGMSDFKQIERLIAEMNTMHDLLLDATLLAVLPMFTKLREAGLPDAQKFLRPGGMLDVTRVDGVKALTKFDPGLEHAFSMIASLQEKINETRATQPNVRGAVSTIGRVSATESQGRLQQALQRQKQSVIRMEGEMDPLALQAMMLWHQFEQGPMTAAVGGDEDRKDPFASYTTEDFIWALQMDFRFRGATRALNRELSAQQLKDLLQTASTLRLVTPAEGRTLIKSIYEILGHKGSAQVFGQQGDAAIAAQAQLEARATASQNAAQGATNQAQQNQAAATPDEITLPEGGGGEAPPPGDPNAPPPEDGAAPAEAA